MKQIETFYRVNIAPLLPEIWDGGLFVSMTTPIVVSDSFLNERTEATQKHDLFFEFSSNIVDGVIVCEVYDIETDIVLDDKRFEDSDELCIAYLSYLISVGLTDIANGLALAQVSKSVCDFCEEEIRVEHHPICERCRTLLGD